MYYIILSEHTPVTIIQCYLIRKWRKHIEYDLELFKTI